MTWQEIVENPTLQDLPYKIETNEQGQLIMTPTKIRHGSFQSKIGILLDRQLESQGVVVTECAIQTSAGTKVADVAWFSNERWLIVQDDYDASVAPEICVEVLSDSNTRGEMETKRKLYFEREAREVWICDKNGQMTFFDVGDEISSSRLAPEFPHQILPR